MELNWLKYFYEVAGAQSVTRASQKMRISQPAVTKMIKQLEGNLGYPLFRRKGRGLQLTSEGQTLYQACVPIFKQLNVLSQLNHGLNKTSAELLRIGASDNICNYLFPKLISGFQKSYPNLQWSIYAGTSHEIKHKILSGELDYGFFYTSLALREKELFDEVILSQVPFKLVYLPALGDFKTVANLNRAQLTYIGARQGDYANTLPEQWVHNKMGISLDRVIESSSKETQKRFVLRGMGFGIFPEFMVHDELKSGKLRALKTADSSIEIRLIHRRNETPSPFMNLFLKEFMKP